MKQFIECETLMYETQGCYVCPNCSNASDIPKRKNYLGLNFCARLFIYNDGYYISYILITELDKEEFIKRTLDIINKELSPLFGDKCNMINGKYHNHYGLHAFEFNKETINMIKTLIETYEDLV